MQDWAAIYANKSGIFPDVLSIDSSGAATPDGTEYIAAGINNFQMGFSQALMDHANLTPNGVTEAAGASQLLDAIGKGFAVGPGMYVQWGLFDDPATTGHRVLLINNQGVLRSAYPDLDNKVYVGDGNNATAVYFYHADDAGGTIRNTTGAYLILPSKNPTYLKQYSEANGDFTVTGTNWTTDTAVVIPYQTIDGTWEAILNIDGSFSSGAVSNIILTMSGITFANNGQTMTVLDRNIGSRAADQQTGVNITGGSGVIQLLMSSSIGIANDWYFAGPLELDSKPTFADDFEFPWGITY